MADALDLGSSVFGHESSTLSGPTSKFRFTSARGGIGRHSRLRICREVIVASRFKSERADQQIGESMREKYVIQLASSSHCPNCKKTVDLLCGEGVKFDPAFYICWGCRTVAQVGVGPVQQTL